MSQGLSRDYEMAVGSANILDPSLIGGDTLYAGMEGADPAGVGSSSWTTVKSSAAGQLCRVCASAADYLIPIYDGQGLEHKLEEKILKHLPIKVTISDTLPLVVCYTCASTVIAWDTLIAGCLEADRKLRLLLEEAAAATKVEEEAGESMTFEEQPADNPDLDSDDEPLVEKVRQITEKKATPIKKQILSKSRRVSNRSEKTATKEEESGVERANSVKDADILPPGDIKEILSMDVSPRDVSSVGRNTDPAPDIGAILADAAATGLRLSVRGRSYAECPMCGQVFRRAEIGQHLAASHQMTVEKDVLYKCELCQKEFRKKHFLQRHMESIHERIVKAECETCGKRFTDKSNYKQHLLIHMGKRTYICQICGRSFVQPQGLRMHMPTHATKANFVCDFCSKGFRRKQHFNLHMLKHFGKKTHQCETCGKAFVAKNELRMHSWIHKSEWPYTCGFCNKGFNQSFGLKTHVRNHHSHGI